MRSAHCLLFVVAACAPAGQLFTPADWWDWRDLSAPRINAEGTSVVYVESWNLRDGDRTCSNLWTVSTAAGVNRAPLGRPNRQTETRRPACTAANSHGEKFRLRPLSMGRQCGKERLPDDCRVQHGVAISRTAVDHSDDAGQTAYGS